MLDHLQHPLLVGFWKIVYPERAQKIARTVQWVKVAARILHTVLVLVVGAFLLQAEGNNAKIGLLLLGMVMHPLYVLMIERFPARCGCFLERKLLTNHARGAIVPPAALQRMLNSRRAL